MKKQLLKQKKIACNNIEQALKAKKEVLELLGMGTFGVVFLGCLNDLCDEKIGVKFLTMKKKYNIDKDRKSVV